MKIDLKGKLENIIIKLNIGLKRFYEAIIMAIITGILLIVLNHINDNLDNSKLEVLKKFIMIFALAIPIFLNIKIIFERNKISYINKIIIRLGAMFFLITYYLFLLKDFSFVTTSRYTAFSLVLYLTFLILPQFKSKDSYELYVVNIILRFLSTYLYSIILYLGLAASIFTIDVLIVKISSKVYLDLWIIAAVIFAPIFFLSDIPEIESKFNVEHYNKVLKILLAYIVIPLIGIYTIIMYSYFIKVILTKDWPEGMVGNLILWYSIISIVVLFLTYPLKEKNKYVRIFVNILPKAILPLMIMLYISIGIRINAYGLTENRYYVVIAATWVALNMIYLSLIKQTRNVIIVISLSIFIFLSVAGPLSSYSLSKQSQNDRLESILKKNDMLENNIIIAKENISVEDKAKISSVVQYFNSKYNFKGMKYVPQDFTQEKMKDVFGFNLIENNYEVVNNYFYFNMKSNEKIFNIKDYDYMIKIDNYTQANLTYENEELKAEYDNNKKIISIIKDNKEIYSQNIENIVSKIYEENKSYNNMELSKERLTLNDSSQKFKVTYVFNNINGFKDNSTEKITLESMDCIIFLKYN